MYVFPSVKNVRSGPCTNYKSVGSLKNNIQVTVYSQTKSGWSEIRYNKKKAYVSTKFLRMYSYLMDKTKVYTFKSSGQTWGQRKKSLQ
ncbi:SH3 domain-containing protein [Domibacillus iocasae]|uniref:SH3 domain-containing protein n=1 Tax=Domibacillus iocasae TaxID=1714016 RepID=UPI003CCC3B31